MSGMRFLLLAAVAGLAAAGPLTYTSYTMAQACGSYYRPYEYCMTDTPGRDIGGAHAQVSGSIAPGPLVASWHGSAEASALPGVLGAYARVSFASSPYTWLHDSCCVTKDTPPQAAAVARTLETFVFSARGVAPGSAGFLTIGLYASGSADTRLCTLCFLDPTAGIAPVRAAGSLRVASRYEDNAGQQQNGVDQSVSLAASATNSSGQGGFSSNADLFQFILPIVWGRPVELKTELSASVRASSDLSDYSQFLVTGGPGFAVGFAEADFSHTLSLVSWSLTANGAPVTDFTYESGSGAVYPVPVIPASAVPEPGSFVLIAPLLLGTALWRLRHR